MQKDPMRDNVRYGSESKKRTLPACYINEKDDLVSFTVGEIQKSVARIALYLTTDCVVYRRSRAVRLCLLRFRCIEQFNNELSVPHIFCLTKRH